MASSIKGSQESMLTSGSSAQLKTTQALPCIARSLVPRHSQWSTSPDSSRPSNPRLVASTSHAARMAAAFLRCQRSDLPTQASFAVLPTLTSASKDPLTKRSLALIRRLRRRSRLSSCASNCSTETALCCRFSSSSCRTFRIHLSASMLAAPGADSTHIFLSGEADPQPCQSP